jgi:hypothetical protein
MPPAATWGLVTCDGWTAHRHATGRELVVLLDGLDVTRRCRAAHDGEGWAELMRMTVTGRIWPWADGEVFRRMHGTVAIAETEAAS